VVTRQAWKDQHNWRIWRQLLRSSQAGGFGLILGASFEGMWHRPASKAAAASACPACSIRSEVPGRSGGTFSGGSISKSSAMAAPSGMMTHRRKYCTPAFFRQTVQE